MHALRTIARWEFTALLIAFGVITMYKLLQKGSFAGLLRADDGSMSPGRAQLLVLTIIAALQYLLTTIHDPTRIPVLPPHLVTALGGSQVVYLGAKAWTMFLDNRKMTEK